MEYSEEFAEMTIAGAVSQFGAHKQCIKAQEECAELIQRISRFLLGDIKEADIAEEVADVEIMCAQLRLITGGEAVDIWKKKKIIRLAERTGLHSVPYGGDYFFFPFTRLTSPAIGEPPPLG